MSLIIQRNPIRGDIDAYSKNTRKNSETSVNSKYAVKTEETSQTAKLTIEEEMAMFKQEFYQDIEKIKFHSTVKNAAVNVSDKAFEKMKEDPQYREKMLSLLQRDLCSSYAPRDTSVILTVGESLDQYRGDSWPTNNDSGFWGRSKNSFYKKTDNKNHDDDKKLSEEHLKLLIKQQSFEQKCQQQASIEVREEHNAFLKAARLYAEMQDLYKSNPVNNYV
ncbi:hypothetical protein [Desulfobacter vibrioformis]|uniref:hypothetical protein n=1 Tax=Desulfobacter vibrioformis TaxID=34031 RepID=UPI00068F4153|nr:hypothetical protein [Desulfobacter vibrioformis]